MAGPPGGPDLGALSRAGSAPERLLQEAGAMASERAPWRIWSLRGRSMPEASGLPRLELPKRRLSLFCPRREETCRICFESDNILNLCVPCGCRGEMKYVHHDCCQRWISQDRYLKADHCEVCCQKWAPECGFEVPEPSEPRPETVEARAFEVLWAAWLALEHGLASRREWEVLIGSGGAMDGPWSRWVARRHNLQKTKIGALYLRCERACFRSRVDRPPSGLIVAEIGAGGETAAAVRAALVRSLWLKACHGQASVEEHRELVKEGLNVEGPWSAYVLRREKRKRSVVGRFMLRMEEESIAWQLSEPPCPAPLVAAP